MKKQNSITPLEAATLISETVLTGYSVNTQKIANKVIKISSRLLWKVIFRKYWEKRLFEYRELLKLATKLEDDYGLSNIVNIGQIISKENKQQNTEVMQHNTMLPTLPFIAKLVNHKGAVKVKSVDGDKCIVEIRVADPYLNYGKEAKVGDLTLFKEHKCIPDNFHGHCPVCGWYCW